MHLFFITAQFNLDSRGRSVAHIEKVVPSPNESASRDSNMCFHPYGIVIHLPAQPTTHWYASFDCKRLWPFSQMTIIQGVNNTIYNKNGQYITHELFNWGGINHFHLILGHNIVGLTWITHIKWFWTELTDSAHIKIKMVIPPFLLSIIVCHISSTVVN